MPRLILNEDEVTLGSIANQIDDAGLDVTIDEDTLILHTDSGLGFTLSLDTDRKFIVFRTVFPMRNDFLDGHDFCNDLNIHVFMGCFAVDKDSDLLISYAYSYTRGLIVAQLMRVVLRFGSMLDHVVGKDTEKLIFDFSKQARTVDVMDAPPLIQ